MPPPACHFRSGRFDRSSSGEGGIVGRLPPSPGHQAGSSSGVGGTGMGSLQQAFFLPSPSPSLLSFPPLLSIFYHIMPGSLAHKNAFSHFLSLRQGQGQPPPTGSPSTGVITQCLPAASPFFFPDMGRLSLSSSSPPRHWGNNAEL